MDPRRLWLILLLLSLLPAGGCGEPEVGEVQEVFSRNLVCLACGSGRRIESGLDEEADIADPMFLPWFASNIEGDHDCDWAGVGCYTEGLTIFTAWEPDWGYFWGVPRMTQIGEARRIVKRVLRASPSQRTDWLFSGPFDEPPFSAYAGPDPLLDEEARASFDEELEVWFERHPEWR